MHVSLPKLIHLLVLASSVCWSLQCLISALTQGGKGGHLFRLTCSVMLWGGRNTANKYHWHVWECSQCLGRIESAAAHGKCALPVSTSEALGSSAGELSEAGPGLRALPRSEPLRFRFLGTPQWSGISRACSVCPSWAERLG